MNSTPIPSQLHGRFEFLDCARGLAAVLVLFSHTLSKPILDQFGGWFNLGIIGVSLFFFVSGFIIPISLNRGGIRRFCISRLFRLYPLYWVSLFVAVLIMFPTKYLDGDQWFTVFSNFLMLQAFVNQPDVLGVYWTLGVELGFYFLCMICFRINLLQNGKLLAWLAVSGLFVATSISWFVLGKAILPWFTLYITIAFMGNYFYHLSANQESLLKAVPILLVFLLVNILHAWMMVETDYYHEVGRAAPTALSLMLSRGIALGIFILLFTMRSRQFPHSLIYLGVISYSVYLLHQIVIWLVPSTLSDILRVSLVVTVSILVSSAAYHLLEKPFIRMGRGIINRTPAL